MKNHDHLEEKFFTRKERKGERKLARKTDRSKFKKTDQEKEKQKASLEREKREKREDLLEGRVLQILPEEIVVQSGEKIYSCTLKGKLKKERQRVKNLIVVGDFVFFEKEGAIVDVEKRKSTLSKKASHHSHKRQIIASNIDIIFITTSILSPRFDPSVVDRFLIAAEKGGMIPIVVINKIDLMKDKEELEEILQIYKNLGLQVICVSAKTGKGMEELKRHMRGKATLFAGPSGVGKSSLINTLTGLNLATAEVTFKTQKGVHTTVGARLVPLNFGGWCVDSPGIQSFGLWDLTRDDLEHFFPEIFENGRSCKFPDCTHTIEPGCEVIPLVEEKKISPLRYNSYLKLRSELS